MLRFSDFSSISFFHLGIPLLSSYHLLLPPGCLFFLPYAAAALSFVPGRNFFFFTPAKGKLVT